MDCFYHPNTNAVCLCRTCGRGLCMQCGVDIGEGLTCTGRCEEKARETLVQSAKITSMSESIAKQQTQGLWFSVATSLFFIGIGLALYLKYESETGLALSALGVIFLLRAIMGFRATPPRQS